MISHIHPDHCADLIALYTYLAYGPANRTALPVFLPPGTVDSLAALLRAGEGHPFFSILDFKLVDDGDLASAGPFELAFARTNHSVPTIATRFEAAGSSLAYSADTGPGGGYPDLAAGSDAVLCEATMVGTRNDDSYDHHLFAVEAGELGAAGGGRLIVTHLSPTVDRVRAVAEAAAGYGREPELAVPGLQVSI